MREKQFAGWLQRNIGRYSVPSRERVNDAARAAIALGGRVVDNRHRPRTLAYGPRSQMAPTHTCACGEVGTPVELPPRSFPPDPDTSSLGSRIPRGPLRVCVRCDGAHLMPRFADA